MSVEKQIEELEELCRRMTFVYGGEPGWVTLGRVSQRVGCRFFCTRRTATT